MVSRFIGNFFSIAADDPFKETSCLNVMKTDLSARLLHSNGVFSRRASSQKASSNGALCKGECGAAFLEFTVVLWFLVMLLLSAFDLGNLLSQYYHLSQVAFEAARSASMVEGLREPARLTSLPNDAQVSGCQEILLNPRHVEAHSCGLIIAQLRTRTLLHAVLPGIDSESITIEVSYDDSNKHVEVYLRSQLNALFPPYRYLPVRAKVRLPYLAVSEKIRGGV